MLERMSEAPTPRKRRLAGILTTAELLGYGKTEQQIRTLVARGTLIRLRQGVYAQRRFARAYLGRPAGEYALQVAAALAIAGPDAVASHHSAARLLGIDLLGRERASVTLTCRPDRDWISRSGIHVYAAELPSDHVCAIVGAPSTTPARTVIDLARLLEFRAGVVAADSALHLKLTTKAELGAVIEALPRRRGISRARAVVAFADGRAESPLESLARVVFRNVRLPPPDLQVWVGETVPIARVDFLWRQYRTVAEVDGAFKYDNPERARDQLRRDQLLRAEGYEVVHFSWNDINSTPGLVATELRDAFERSRAIAAGRRAAGGPAKTQLSSTS
jgi:very-short-patch-repair endonuclease